MDIALKQRLVGASVLIAFAVVVLPMLFGGRPDSGAPGAARIEIEENPEAVQFETRRSSKESAAQSLERMQSQLRHFRNREREILEQLEDSVGALKGAPFSDEELAEIDRYAQPGAGVDLWNVSAGL